MAVTFDLGADLTGRARSTTVESSAGVISGASGSVGVGLTGDSSSYFRINGGGWVPITDKSLYLVSNGDTVQVRHTTAASFNTMVSTTLTVGGVPDTWSSTTELADTTPDAFDFTDVTGVEPSSVNTSAPVTITGMNALSGGSVTGGQFNVNGGVFTSGVADVANLDQVRARGTASGSFSTAVNVDVTVGGVTGRYTITTRAPVTMPAPFAFNDVSSASALTVVTSNTINVTGIEAAANVTFTPSGGTSHEYSKNGGAWTAVGATTVNDGDTLAVRLTTPSGTGSSGNLTVDIGGRSDTYSATVAVPDSTPDAFAFVDNANVAKSTVATSNIITIAGIDTTAAVSFTATGGSGHEYRKNAGAWTTIGADSVVNSDTLQVRLTVPGTAGQTGEIEMTVGGVADTYTATAQEPDAVPDAFAFTPVAGADPNEVTASAAIVVAGINTAATISVAGGEYSVNGGGWTSSPGAVQPGDQVQVRLTSASALAVTVTATVTIGGVAGGFSVTTRAPDTSAQFVITFRDSVYGAVF